MDRQITTSFQPATQPLVMTLSSCLPLTKPCIRRLSHVSLLHVAGRIRFNKFRSRLTGSVLQVPFNRFRLQIPFPYAQLQRGADSVPVVNRVCCYGKIASAGDLMDFHEILTRAVLISPRALSQLAVYQISLLYNQPAPYT